MTNAVEIGGTIEAPRGKIAIVASRFNEMVVNQLIAGAESGLTRHGMSVDQIEIMKVPGAYEIPLMCQQAAKSGRYVGIIALGAVIRGDTAHFDYVAGPCAQGIMQVQLQTGVPITFGVLTTENMEQALARAGGTVGNKGTEAAIGLLEVLGVLNKLQK